MEQYAEHIKIPIKYSLEELQTALDLLRKNSVKYNDPKELYESLLDYYTEVDLDNLLECIFARYKFSSKQKNSFAIVIKKAIIKIINRLYGKKSIRFIDFRSQIRSFASKVNRQNTEEEERFIPQVEIHTLIIKQNRKNMCKNFKNYWDGKYFGSVKNSKNFIICG